MAKARRTQSARRGGSSEGHGLRWFLVGALVGGAVTWASIGHDPTAEQVRATVGRTVGHPVGVGESPPPPKPRFEFYTLLPEMEVVVPDEDLDKPQPAPSKPVGEEGAASAPESQATEEEPKRETEAALDSGHYVLQIASFRSMKEADGLRAKLALLGFEPVVQSVAVNSDENWYRVRIGPYTDRDALEAARIRLRADGVRQSAGRAREEGIVERVMGIEPTSSAWEAEVLPLNYTRGGLTLRPEPIVLASACASTSGHDDPPGNRRRAASMVRGRRPSSPAAPFNGVRCEAMSCARGE